MKFNIWKDYPNKPLPEVLSFIVDNRGKTVPTDPNGKYTLIATNCIRNENLYPTHEKIRTLNERTYREWFRAHPEPNDIIFVNKGTPGRVCLVPNPVNFCIAQDMIALRANPKIIYYKYLFAVLRSSKIQNQIKSTTVGDVIPHFKKHQLKELNIPIPPMNIQKTIGDYYFMFCEKEECNKKINKNLEAQTQAIYVNTFVTDADSSWPEGKLSDLIEVCYGKDHKKLNDGDIPVYGSGGIMRHVDQALYDQESVLVPRKGTLNNVMYVNEPFWSVDTMFFTKMKRQNVAKFVFHFLKGKDLAAMNAGSAVPSMTTKILDAIPLQIPDDQTLSTFEAQVSPFYQAVTYNNKESETLAAVRNALLPKLMSGEIDVSDIDL